MERTKREFANAALATHANVSLASVVNARRKDVAEENCKNDTHIF